jgi:hypothetical protein
MQLAILIKKISKVFMMIPFWALIPYGPLSAPFFCPQCGVQYLLVLKLVWFLPIDGVISLVMHKKRVCLSKIFQML